MNNSEIIEEAKRLLSQDTPKPKKKVTKIIPLMAMAGITKKEKEQQYKSLLAWGKKKIKIKPLTAKEMRKIK
jgi:hypothetical protein